MTRSDNTAAYTFQWYIDRFEDAKEEAVQFCQPIREDRFVQRPAEEVWSVAECYEHLNEYNDRYMVSIRNGMNRARGNSTETGQPFKPGFIWRGVIRFFAPPYKLKIKTLKPFEPRSYAELDKEAVLNRFISLQDTLIDTIQEARDKRIDLSGIKTSHPLFGFLKMTLSECFAVVDVHQRRHMWQAEQILKRIN